MRTLALTLLILILFVGICGAVDVKPKWSYETGVVRSVAISSDGKYVAGNFGNRVSFFDQSGKLLWSYNTSGEVWSVAITPNGKYVVAGDDNGVYLFDNNFVPPIPNNYIYFGVSTAIVLSSISAYGVRRWRKRRREYVMKKQRLIREMENILRK